MLATGANFNIKHFRIHDDTVLMKRDKNDPIVLELTLSKITLFQFHTSPFHQLVLDTS